MSDHYTSPNQYSFLNMSPPTTFATTIKYIIANFDDKFKKYLKETITKYDATFYKQLQIR